tara:strand:+ start:403 stop:1440 length:1038 start_codon:yes stop_codon:yes gene_type:complete
MEKESSMVPAVTKSENSFNLPIKLNFLNSINDQMLDLDRSLVEKLTLKSETAASLADHIFSSKSKRIRPALFFLVAKMLGYSGKHLLSMAVVAEYIHTASLLHDDVIDNSTLRRGRASANTVWGDKSAILVGDLIYARASEIMAEADNLEIVTSFAGAIRDMTDGELLQLENAFNADINESTYLEIIKMKTGVLLGAVCKVSGLLAQISHEKCQALKQFGEKLGIAFQILDDALDLQTCHKDFGKENFSDIREGRVTLPVIHILASSNKEEKDRLYPLIKEGNMDKKSLLFFMTLAEKYDVINYVKLKARAETKNAVEILETNFPPSDARENLISLTQKLLSRTV